MDMIDVWVPGRPFPQGSKRAFVNPRTGKAILTEQAGVNLKSWRTGIREAMANTLFTTTVAPVRVSVLFYFRRPTAHYGSGKNAAVLKPGAPAFPFNRSVGDVDKLLRAVLDSLVHAQVMADDSQVVDLAGAKLWIDGFRREEGANVRIVEVATPGDLLDPMPSVG